MSSIFKPCRSKSRGTAVTGPTPISSGSTPAVTKPRKMPSGLRPFCVASASLMTTQADAPSESWLAFPAVMVLPSNTGLILARPSAVVSGRGPSSCASVTSRRETCLVSLSMTVILVAIGTSSSLKTAALKGGCGAALALEAVLVLALARNLVAFRDHFGVLEHRDIHLGLHRHEPVVDRVKLVHVLVLHEADRFDAAGHRDLYAIEHHRTRGDRDRLQARRALPINRRAGDGDWQSGADRALAR